MPGEVVAITPWQGGVALLGVIGEVCAVEGQIIVDFNIVDFNVARPRP